MEQLLKFLSVLLFISGLFPALAQGNQPGGAASTTTEILRWKDGKKGVFFMGFDDSTPTSMSKVIPELQKRKMTATFYTVPGSAWHKKNQELWDHPLPGVEYGNHTYTHKGVASREELEGELRRANDEIARCFPDRKLPRLISFGKPGGVPWSLTPDETRAVLAKFNLIWRPDFRGYPGQIKTVEELAALPAKAVAEGGMEYVYFHGVDGDWLSTPWDVFTALLDALEKERNELWITDPVSWHQYATERDSTKIKLLESTLTKLRIGLESSLDVQLYNLPLTLSTRVPAGWSECTVTQGERSRKVPVRSGIIVYDALPGGGAVTLQSSASK